VPVSAITKSTNVHFVFDNWNYINGIISIKIQKVQKGTGSNQITLYVANVALSNINYLHTAFAKNEFGLHITQQASQIAKNNNALLAINGDYYGYRNDGIIVRNGVLYRDNPARNMLALFKNGSMSVLNEKTVNVKGLMSKGLLDSFSFGPALVINGKAANTFSSVYMDNWFIQGDEPRTGVGFLSPDHFIFIVVDGRKNNYSRGETLAEFTKEFLSRGCKIAYNLDGGGSSTMYFNGRLVNNPLGKNGTYERNVSDILYISNPN
jgi:exopolysaccharide biosynthesis protein